MLGDLFSASCVFLSAHSPFLLHVGHIRGRRTGIAENIYVGYRVLFGKLCEATVRVDSCVRNRSRLEPLERSITFV